MKKHLAIFSAGFAELVLAGKKTIDTRFSLKRIPPFGRVSPGDVVYIKPVGRDIRGRFLVKKVIYFEGLDDGDLSLIDRLYGGRILPGAGEERSKFFERNASKNFASLIFIDRVEQFLTAPVKVDKKDRRGWVVLD